MVGAGGAGGMSGTRRVRGRQAVVLASALAVCASFVAGFGPAAGATAKAPATSAAAAPQTPPDPGDPGPLAVSLTEYNFGDTAYTPPALGHAGEMRASVHYPTGLPGGPYPLIVLLHGRHVTCHNGGSVSLQWPCPAGWSTIPSFQGYDYLGDNLASWGYIVVSISANAINAFDNGTSDLGALARAQLIQHHLDQWNTFNTSGGAPFGTQFVGKVDLTRVGTMGHSRGGEGVVRQVLLNQSLGSPYGIKAVLPLAPVDFNRPVFNNIPMDVILPYCDGDVSDLQGIHFYDDSRYNVAGDTAAKHSLLVMGANHNYFNNIWTPGVFAGGVDDWIFSGGSDPQCGTQAGSQRLTPAQQRAVGLAYMAGFFRLYIGGETALLPYFDGSPTQPASVGTADLHDAYHPPDTPGLRLDLNRFLTATDLTTDFQGGAVTSASLTPQDLCGGNSPQPSQCLASFSTTQQPHTTPSALSAKRGLSQLRTGWTASTGSMSNALPVGTRDVSAYEALSFRIAANFGDARTTAGQALDLRVQLVDGTGANDSEIASTWSDSLYYPPGATGGVVPKVVLNTVRVPLSAFAGVDIHNIASVNLIFDQKTKGAVLMTDLAFVSDQTSAGLPTLSIADSSHKEGSTGGTTPFRFAVTLSAASATPVMFHIATADGTATAPGDYASVSKNVKFKPGTTSRKIAIAVVADLVAEPNETFTVQLSSPTGATIADGTGTGTIRNDD
jgi:hypothetical protein